MVSNIRSEVQLLQWDDSPGRTHDIMWPGAYLIVHTMQASTSRISESMQLCSDAAGERHPLTPVGCGRQVYTTHSTVSPSIV